MDKQKAVLIENQVFNWEGYDRIHNLVTIFYNVVLTKAISKDFPIGRKFDNAVIDYYTSTMTFREDDIEYNFHMSISLSPIKE